MGLSFEKTFVGILEKEKNNFNFYNLIAGYSPTVYQYQVKELIKKDIIPSKIFLTLDISDVKDEASKWQLRQNSLRPIFFEKTEEKKQSF